MRITDESSVFCLTRVGELFRRVYDYFGRYIGGSLDSTTSEYEKLGRVNVMRGHPKGAYGQFPELLAYGGARILSFTELGIISLAVACIRCSLCNLLSDLPSQLKHLTSSLYSFLGHLEVRHWTAYFTQLGSGSNTTRCDDKYLIHWGCIL